MYMQENITQIKKEMIGSFYQHFKGGVYLVTDICVHAETQELMVLYKNIDDNNLLWCRPLSIFIEKVKDGKYNRFEKIYNNKFK